MNHDICEFPFRNNTIAQARACHHLASLLRLSDRPACASSCACLPPPPTSIDPLLPAPSPHVQLQPQVSHHLVHCVLVTQGSQPPAVKGGEGNRRVGISLRSATTRSTASLFRRGASFLQVGRGEWGTGESAMRASMISIHFHTPTHALVAAEQFPQVRLAVHAGLDDFNSFPHFPPTPHPHTHL